MRGTIRFEIPSLRGKLGLTAFAALLATAIVTTLLLLTAGAANDVVQTARLSQERSRIYLQIQSAASDYQHASFTAIRDDSEPVLRRVAETRTRMENLLAEANRLPVEDPDDIAGSARVEARVLDLIDHFAHSDELVARVNRQWREAGGQAALREANIISTPIYTLRETLLAEITRSDAKVAAATKEARSLIESAIIASFIALAVALAASLTVIILMQTRLHPGLRKLGEGAQAFGEGDLDHRIALKGEDELAQLGSTFNAMAQTISDKQDALREVQAGLENTVAERTHELEEANAKLSTADERRRAFFAEISHELRTPLTVIKGEAQVAMRTSGHKDFDLHGSFDRILEQTELLTRMVNDLFLIARAQAGRLPLQRRMLNLRNLAERVTADLGNLAAENGGEIRLEDGPDVLAFVDPDRVKRALLALTENALVHCQPGVKIAVAVTEENGQASISVSDDGPGLDFAQSEQLFERFRRGNSDAKGSGLGLSLVHALAAAHGGVATLHPSEAGGTRAVITFPAAMEQAIDEREVA